LKATWKERTRIPVLGHVGENWHNGRSRGRGAHTISSDFLGDVAMRSGIQLWEWEAGVGVVESE